MVKIVMFDDWSRWLPQSDVSLYRGAIFDGSEFRISLRIRSCLVEGFPTSTITPKLNWRTAPRNIWVFSLSSRVLRCTRRKTFTAPSITLSGCHQKIRPVLEPEPPI